jgi:hypothetical protein
MPETPDGGWILDCGDQGPDVYELARLDWEASQKGDWWEMREGEVHLTRMPLEGEALRRRDPYDARQSELSGRCASNTRRDAAELRIKGARVVDRSARKNSEVHERVRTVDRQPQGEVSALCTKVDIGNAVAAAGGFARDDLQRSWAKRVCSPAF